MIIVVFRGIYWCVQRFHLIILLELCCCLINLLIYIIWYYGLKIIGDKALSALYSRGVCYKWSQLLPLHGTKPLGATYFWDTLIPEGYIGIASCGRYTKVNAERHPLFWSSTGIFIAGNLCVCALDREEWWGILEIASSIALQTGTSFKNTLN